MRLAPRSAFKLAIPIQLLHVPSHDLGVSATNQTHLYSYDLQHGTNYPWLGLNLGEYPNVEVPIDVEVYLLSRFE